MAQAHDLVLRSRQQSYQPFDLRKMVDHERSAFEGWTHDALILPIEAFPHWLNKFTRDAVLLQQHWKTWHRGDFLAQTQTIWTKLPAKGPWAHAMLARKKNAATAVGGIGISPKPHLNIFGALATLPSPVGMGLAKFMI